MGETAVARCCRPSEVAKEAAVVFPKIEERDVKNSQLAPQLVILIVIITLCMTCYILMATVVQMCEMLAAV
jgi:hypothetical protein